jgi:hypothetical protein
LRERTTRKCQGLRGLVSREFLWYTTHSEPQKNEGGRRLRCSLLKYFGSFSSPQVRFRPICCTSEWYRRVRNRGIRSTIKVDRSILKENLGRSDAANFIARKREL